MAQFSRNTPLIALILVWLGVFPGIAVGQPRPIAEAQFVTIGGIQQWVTIRGRYRTNPALIFLHGGPGDLIATYAPYERNFVFVQWDQRNAGRTDPLLPKQIQPSIEPC
jgi:pimeloyl-ACP methyl ester carboxylesterase